MTASIVEYMNKESVKGNIQDTLGAKTPQFIASIASLVNANSTLQNCDQKSILSACLIAATLDLPTNQNLGFAYIIPYGDKAQFQMGYKGFIQLAQRSGLFKTINVSDVKEGEIKGINRLSGEIDFEWIEKDRSSQKTIGFVSYFKLLNGFEKTLYMSVDDLKKHGARFSQSYKKGYGLWKDDFDSMGAKTVVKLLLSKYGPMTVQMQKAQIMDQAVVIDDNNFEYSDNQPVDAKEVGEEKETQRIIKFIEEAKTVEELEKCMDAVGFQPEHVIQQYEAKQKELTKK